MRAFRPALALAVVLGAGVEAGRPAEPPGGYFRLFDDAVAQVGKRLAAEPGADLESLEAAPGWRHFPSAILVAAVLYASPHPANRHRGDPQMLRLALQIGDLLAAEQAKGRYDKRLDHHRDTYMWLDAYRLLERELGNERQARWRRALLDLVAKLAAEVARRQDYPWYNSPYIGTSPNHYSLWSATVFLAGRVFGNREWEALGAKVLHRFAAEEQAPDGYWGEHSRRGPTTNYDYLTATAVALYWECSKDPAALEALRRSTGFHTYFTWPDGLPVETVNDRNRYGYVSMWGHFGFSHFPEGRRYAEFLLSRYPAARLSLEALGRIAQDALYFHEGPTAPIPQDGPRYARRLAIPAGIRKSGPWVVCLSGIIDTPAPTSQFYLDRQGNVSVFHEKLGLLVTGANSKRQPELATFWEKIGGQMFHLPMSSRLDMSDERDRLALSYNTFFSVIEVPAPSEKELLLHFAITPRGRLAEASLNLQLCLKAGEALETAAGRKIILDATKIELGPDQIGGWLRHQGWTLKPDPAARLLWPYYPFNPYANAPEQGLEHAVGVLSTPLRSGASELVVALEATP